MTYIFVIQEYKNHYKNLKPFCSNFLNKAIFCILVVENVDFFIHTFLRLTYFKSMEYALDIGNSYINYQGYSSLKEIMSDGRLTLPQEGDSMCLHDTKVTVVGCGSVGSAVAFALVTKGVANTVVIYDIAKDRCEGEVMDMEQGCQFIDSCKVIGGAGSPQLIFRTKINLFFILINTFYYL